MILKPYLTVNEVSQEIRRSPQRIREAVARGELRAVQFTPRGVILIKRDDLAAYLNANLVSPLAGRVV